MNTYLDMHIDLRQIKDGFSSEFDQRKSWIRRIIKSVFSVREEKKTTFNTDVEFKCVIGVHI